MPAPVVLLDVPGGTYWTSWARFIDEELASAGLIGPHDNELYLVTDDADRACAEIVTFWRNYDSIRWVGDKLVLRLRAEPTDEEVAELNDRFADLLVGGRIERSEPLAAERSSRDKLEAPRIVMRFNPRQAGRLRALIDAVNQLDSARAQAS